MDETCRAACKTHHANIDGAKLSVGPGTDLIPLLATAPLVNIDASRLILSQRDLVLHGHAHFTVPRGNVVLPVGFIVVVHTNWLCRVIPTLKANHLLLLQGDHVQFSVGAARWGLCERELPKKTRELKKVSAPVLTNDLF